MTKRVCVVSNLLTGKGKGSALVITLGFLVLFILTTFSITAIMGNSSTLSVYHSVRTEALGMAEAGLDDALLERVGNPSWDAGFSNKIFGAGSYSVTVDTGVSSDTIISVGKMPAGSFIKSAVSRTVMLVVSKEGGETYTCTSSNDEIIIDNNSSCIGNVYSSDKIELSSNGDILGNASAQNDINGVGGSNTISGKKNAANYTPVLSTITIPTPLSALTYKTQGQVGGTHGGNETFDGVTQNYGPKYITGNVTIKGGSNITLTGTVRIKQKLTIEEGSTVTGKYVIYVEDDILVEEDCTIGAAGAGPLIIGESNMELKDNITVIDSILYGYKDINMDDVTMSGFVIAKKLTMTNNTDITASEILGMDVTMPSSGTGSSTPGIAWSSD